MKAEGRAIKPWLETDLRAIEKRHAAALEAARVSDRRVLLSSTATVQGHDWCKVTDGVHHILAIFRPQPAQRIVAVPVETVIEIKEARLVYGPALKSDLSGPIELPRLFLVCRIWKVSSRLGNGRTYQTSSVTDIPKMAGWLKSLAARYITHPDYLYPADVRPTDQADPSPEYLSSLELKGSDLQRIDQVAASTVSREPHGDIDEIRRIEASFGAPSAAEVLAQLREGYTAPGSPPPREASPPTSALSANSLERRNLLAAVASSPPQPEAALGPPIVIPQPHPPRLSQAPPRPTAAPMQPSTDSSRGHGAFEYLNELTHTGFFSDVTGETAKPEEDEDELSSLKTGPASDRGTLSPATPRPAGVVEAEVESSPSRSGPRLELSTDHVKLVPRQFSPQKSVQTARQQPASTNIAATRDLGGQSPRSQVRWRA